MMKYELTPERVMEIGKGFEDAFLACLPIDKRLGSPKQVVVEYSIVILVSYLFGLLQVFTGNPTRFGYQSLIL